MDLPDPGIEPGSPAPQVASLPAEPSGKPNLFLSPGVEPSDADCSLVPSSPLHPPLPLPAALASFVQGHQQDHPGRWGLGAGDAKGQPEMHFLRLICRACNKAPTAPGACPTNPSPHRSASGAGSARRGSWAEPNSNRCMASPRHSTPQSLSSPTCVLEICPRALQWRPLCS